MELYIEGAQGVDFEQGLEIVALQEVLQKTPVGKALFVTMMQQVASLHNIVYVLDQFEKDRDNEYRAEPGGAALDVQNNKMRLSFSRSGAFCRKMSGLLASKSHAEQLFGMAAAQKQAWDVSRGLVPSTQLRPEDYATQGGVMKACKYATACAAVYPLALEDGDLFRELAKLPHGDMFMAYAAPPKATDPKEAEAQRFQHAFFQWFDHDKKRAAKEDITSLDFYDQLMAYAKNPNTPEGAVELATREAQEDDFRAFGMLPNGENMLAARPNDFIRGGSLPGFGREAQDLLFSIMRKAPAAVYDTTRDKLLAKPVTVRCRMPEHRR